MSGDAARAGSLADWLSLAAGLTLVAVGVVLVWRPETAILRLATLGLPGWPVYAIAGVQIVAGASLPFRSTRRAAALVLVLLGLGRGAVELTYRDTDAALEALAQALLAAAVLALGTRRR
jgi:uncharacterized protein YjeT (DUF2065 family)